MKSQKAHSCHSRGSGNPGSGFNQSFHYAFFLIKTMKNQYIRISIVGMFAILAVLSLNTVGNAQPTISYQGFIQNNGTPVNGSTTLKILIYDVATGGSPFYTETQTVNVANGIFNVMIGAVTPLQPALDFTKQYYLALSINGGAELTPRSLVSFSPYAFRALNADTSSYATTAGRATLANGISGGYVENVNGDNGNLTISGANGITVTNNAPNIVIGNSGVQSVNTASGNITIVGAGGTTVTEAGTKITVSSPTAQTLNGAAGAVTLVGAGATTVTDSGSTVTIRTPPQSFTGIQNLDTTITITNPNGQIATIGLAKQNATSGQVLVWSGTAWRPTTVSGVAPDSLKDLGDVRTYSSDLFLGRGSGINENPDSGADNTAVGIGALQFNTSGQANTAIGESALHSNTTAYYNTATGYAALTSNTTGNHNIAYGYQALFSNTIGYFNSAFGETALRNNTTGSGNTALGSSALVANGSGWSNVAVGIDAQFYNFGRSNIVAVGDSSLYFNDFTSPSGDSATANTALGSKTLYTNRTGAYNTATGYQALYSNYSGYYNNADGVKALWSNSSGNYNTATGFQALTASTTGSFNTAYGYLALQQNTTGSNNASFGDNTGPTSSSLSNTTCLGSGAQASSSNEVVLGNASVSSLYCQGAYAATTAASANMVVTASGQIMRSTSSARYKTDIHDLDINTDRLYDLRPVSYISKIDGKPYFGLVAEDVAKVIPDLAEYARSKDVIPGSTSDALIPDAVKYPMLSVLLLEELKKEHAKVETEEQQVESAEKMISDLAKRVEALESAQKAMR